MTRLNAKLDITAKNTKTPKKQVTLDNKIRTRQTDVKIPSCQNSLSKAAERVRAFHHVQNYLKSSYFRRWSNEETKESK